jgi:DNA helicase II / ATP-dependent DNA helicase PcrA
VNTINNNIESRKLPIGAKTTNIHEAQLAELKTSVELIENHDEDHAFFQHLETFGITLNKSQLYACRHVKGPLLTLAGAGTGKTTVLVSRTAYLLYKGVDPKNILLMTFTRKASEEMRARIKALSGQTAASQMTAGTFHSVFLKLLRHRGYNQEIISEKSKQISMKILLKELKLHENYKPESLLATLSLYKNHLMNIEELQAKTDTEKEIKKALIRYEAWKKQTNKIDFDDILLETYYLLKENSSLLASLQNRFHYIQVDEFQDTNPLQYELIKMISKPQNNLMVVGDEKQCIYSFNSADHSIILGFENDFPEVKAVQLDVNYRSTSAIVGLANELIKHNKSTKSGDLQATKPTSQYPEYFRPKSTLDEARLIVKDIKEKINKGLCSYKDIAILHRTAANSRSIFEEFVTQEIPFINHSSNEIFYETSIVKPVINYLRLSIDPSNVDALMTIVPSLYLNKEQTYRAITERDIFEPTQKCYEHLLYLPNLKPFQKNNLEKTVSFIDRLCRLKPLEAIKQIRESYDKYVEATDKSNSLHKELIKETLDELEESAKEYETVTEYLSFVDRIIAEHEQMLEQKQQQNVDAVSLMTIHKAKGLEFPIVYFIGASEDIIPHKTSLKADKLEDIFLLEKGINKKFEAIEEERRLAYVALTRCKNQLYISSPKSYRGVEVGISRFILDAYKEQKQTEVWNCTNINCNGWMKVSGDETFTSRPCPICKSDMKIEAKTLYQ